MRRADEGENDRKKDKLEICSSLLLLVKLKSKYLNAVEQEDELRYWTSDNN